MEIFRKQNVATHVVAPLISTASRPAYKTTPTLAAGDILILRHTAGAWNAANIGTLPTELLNGATHLGMLDFTLTGTEVNPDDAAYPVVIYCHDVAGAEWDDQAIVIWTRAQDVADLAPEAGGNVAAIKAKTDLLPAVAAGQASGLPIIAPTGGWLNVTNLPQAAPGGTAGLALFEGKMDLIDAPNTTALAAVAAAAGAINVDSTGGNLALTKAIEALVAACVGKAAYDPATGVVTFKGRNGTSTIVQVTCDGSGNRTASSLS